MGYYLLYWSDLALRASSLIIRNINGNKNWASFQLLNRPNSKCIRIYLTKRRHQKLELRIFDNKSGNEQDLNKQGKAIK